MQLGEILCFGRFFIDSPGYDSPASQAFTQRIRKNSIVLFTVSVESDEIENSSLKKNVKHTFNLHFIQK